VEVTQCSLEEAVQQVTVFLHHEAPSHTSLFVQQFLSSPDLAPSGFWLFSALKMGCKGTSFTTMADIKSNAMAELRKIPK
jgi:hypothetical protein